jgi:enoyl reductase-like protein/3-oxoacyl-ACP reductase-like protein/acyl dehydratase
MANLSSNDVNPERAGPSVAYDEASDISSESVVEGDRPAVFSQRNLYLQFAGQCVASYFSELKALAGAPHTTVFFQKAAILLKELGDDETYSLELPQGLDILAWLHTDVGSMVPDAEYLNSPPVAYPLITLTQLGQFLATCQVVGAMFPEDLPFTGGFGHSSGVMAAAVVALAGSFDEFVDLAVEMVVLQALHGLRCQMQYPVLKLSKSLWRPHYVRGKPTPMLHVKHGGFPKNVQHLDKLIAGSNKHIPDERHHMSIGLANGSASIVVGPAEPLHGLYEALGKVLETNESRVPFSSRTPRLTPQFLDTTVPFHSSQLAGVDAKILDDIGKHACLPKLRELSARRAPFRFPVYDTVDGEEMKYFDLERLVAMQTSKPLDWIQTTQVLASQPGYVLDMGPSSATANMTAFLHEGNGVVVVPAHTSRGMDILTQRLAARLPKCVSWEARFAPRLDRANELVTKFTRLVGRPPIMVPGMTPWSHAAQVAAVARAGYHAELAGGGIPLPGHFAKEIRELALNMPPGAGINVNLLYLNAYLWGFQFPLIEKLAAQGEPLESFTVAAGIPSAEKLRDMVEAAQRSRLKFIAFKPGTADAIRTVVDLCAQFPDFDFVIQWTGGRSGGHHSFEDQYEAILETYPLIRDNANITLVVGGGLGDAADAYEWLSGDWSLRFGRPRMPADAVLMGSRVLATAESRTGEMTKDLMLEAHGVENSDWEQSMRQGCEAGGVITVNSELGEPIHVVKNRCSELWRDFDEKYFSLPPDQMVVALQRDKKKVIEGLNASFQKVWFGSKGGVPCDIGEMTYHEVCSRLTELMFQMPGGKWIDVSYRVRLQEMLMRVEERFAPDDVETVTMVDGTELETNPCDVIERVFDVYSAGRTAQLLIEDQDYFISSVCGRPDRKPVNFILQIDKLFKRYFKSDSLWFSEALNAVPGGDAQRTFIIYGPVAARHVLQKDETIKDLLDGVNNGVKQLLRSSQGAICEIPSHAEWLAELAARNHVKVNVSVRDNEPVLELTLGAQGCDAKAYQQLLAETDFVRTIGVGRLFPGADCASWIKALFQGVVVRGDKRARSPIGRVLRPSPNTVVTLSAGGNRLCVSQLDTPGWSVVGSCPIVEVKFASEGPQCGGCVTVLLRHGKVPLQLKYQFEPSAASCLLHEPAKMRYAASTAFYATVWEDPQAPKSLSCNEPRDPLESVVSMNSVPSLMNLTQAAAKTGLLGEKVTGTDFILTREKLIDFCHAVGLNFDCYMQAKEPQLPVDIAIVAGWTALISAVLRDTRVGSINWLELLHLENRFSQLQVRCMKEKEEKLTSHFEVVEVSFTPTGKKIGVQGVVKHRGKPWVLLTTYFFIPLDIASKEEEEKEQSVVITNKSYLLKCDDVMNSIIFSKAFFRILKPLPVPCDIFVEVHSKDVKRADAPLVIEARGTLTLQDGLEVGLVNYCSKEARGNALIAFLERHAAEYPTYRQLDAPYLVLETPDVTRAPVSMKRYAQVSGDWNPIHTDVTFACLAGLNSPIVHGMWLSANARRVLAEHVGMDVSDFRTNFVDTVPLGARVVTHVKHVGMRGGQCVYEIESRKFDDGCVCLRGTADVRQSPTLLTFTGQGSQFPGMGRDLRESSEAVSAFWARADKHFLSKYGLSILQIVNENPKERTVYFGSPEGARIREVYMSLTRVTPDGARLSVFPSIVPDSVSYTFANNEGLLNSTQFAQPALVLVEMAQYMDLKERQLLPSDALFAGHSLGEYAALSSVAEVLPLENLLDVVFMRGLTMQSFVPRKADGSSDYAMVAVNPIRVNKTFTPAQLVETVDMLGSEEELLQIVNYNVEPLQYVCAGHVRALMALRLVLDEIATTGCNVADAAMKHHATARFVSHDQLRGKATIPLKGIDVPFHSRLLLPGVKAFREVLEQNLANPLKFASVLRQGYIPNVTGIPFAVTKEYVELVSQQTSSEVLSDMLTNWDRAKNDKRRITRTLLIELLAFQFASPVLWTKTIEEAICKQKVARVIEFGPGPVLKGMLKSALAATPALVGKGTIANLHVGDSTDISFGYTDKGPSAEDWVASQRSSADADGTEIADIQTLSLMAPAPSTSTSGPPSAPAPTRRAAAASGPDVNIPIRVVDALKLIIGSRVGEIMPGKTLKQLVGGKSALQNELIGEMSQEFGSEPPENGAELPMEELSKHWPSYTKLGKPTTQLVNKVLLQTMPAGTSLNTLKKQLEEEFAVSSVTTEGIALRAVALAPSKRLTAAEAIPWRASLVNQFNTETGSQVQVRGGCTGEEQVAGPSVAVDPEMAGKLSGFARAISKAANDFLGPAPPAPIVEVPALSPLEAEYGDKFTAGVQPIFSQEQIREYNDWWVIGQRRIRAAWQKCVEGTLDVTSEDGRLAVQFASISSDEAMLPLLSWLSSHSAKDSAGETFLEQVRAQVGQPPAFFESRGTTRPKVHVDNTGNIIYQEVPRGEGMAAYVDEVAANKFVSIQMRGSVLDGNATRADADASVAYIGALRDVAANGICLQGKVALITGLSPGSIAEPVTKMLLQAGATVIGTMRTKRGTKPYEFYRKMYAECCGAGARLIIVPFNQGSRQDVLSLVKYIYADVKSPGGGLGLDVDFFFPFAAMPENGRGIDAIDDVSELAHRVMLTHTVLLMGQIYANKKQQKIVGKQTLVFAPLSPNHGVFGFDGLYAESKLGLESLFHKWRSEGLEEYLSIVGAAIGWVRGTNLMVANNIVTQAMEEIGCRTFTNAEMAFNLAGLMHPDMVRIVQKQPIEALLTGKMDTISDIAGVTSRARAELSRQSTLVKGVKADLQLDGMVESAGAVARARQEKQDKLVRPRPFNSYPARSFAKTPSAERRNALAHLQGMVDPASTVVVTGIAEVGPWGDASTRWEMERDGEFSLEGCVLMAWMLGFIKYFNGPRPQPSGPPVHYSGWTDAATGEPLCHWDVKAKYEEQILGRCGLRILDPAVLSGFDGTNTMLHHTVMLEEDLPPIEVDDMDMAQEFARQHGEFAEISESASGVFTLRMRKGAKIYVPRALRTDRWVCSQVPSGWNAKHFGIPDDIIAQTDRVTLYALVACAHSLHESGIIDPYEFYEYVHLSHVGNAIGSGMGGIHHLKDMFVNLPYGREGRAGRRIAGNLHQHDCRLGEYVATFLLWANQNSRRCLRHSDGVCIDRCRHYHEWPGESHARRSR